MEPINPIDQSCVDVSVRDRLVRPTSMLASESVDEEYHRIRMIVYNIMYGGGNNLNIVLRTMAKMRVEIGFLLETKITHDAYTKDCCGYRVVATKAKSSIQGGIVLFYRSESPWWSIEGTRTHGPNVISCTLVSGTHRRWTLIGAYIAPSEDSGETLEFIHEAVRTRCSHPLIFFGDVNVDFRRAAFIDDRSEVITDSLRVLNLSDVANFFPHPRGRWTWSQWREGHYIRSVTDYVLAEHPDDFDRWAIKCPRYADSDHRLIVVELRASGRRAHFRYLQNRRRWPIILQEPLSKADRLLLELKLHRLRVEPGGQRDRSWISLKTWRLIDRQLNLRRLDRIVFHRKVLFRLKKVRTRT